MTENITRSARNKALWKIRRGRKPVRPGCCAAASGTTARRAAAPRFVAPTAPSTGSTSLASVWCSSRSQLVVRSGFTYEQTSFWSVMSEARGTSAERMERQQRVGVWGLRPKIFLGKIVTAPESTKRLSFRRNFVSFQAWCWFGRGFFQNDMQEIGFHANQTLHHSRRR